MKATAWVRALKTSRLSSDSSFEVELVEIAITSKAGIARSDARHRAIVCGDIRKRHSSGTAGWERERVRGTVEATRLSSKHCAALPSVELWTEGTDHSRTQPDGCESAEANKPCE